MNQESVEDFDLVEQALIAEGRDLAARLSALPPDRLTRVLNEVRADLHEVSPRSKEPTDLVRWVRKEQVRANAYNPNHADERAMELLAKSVREDGFTQPIVVYPVSDQPGMYEIVDGFHRHLVAREMENLSGWLPVTVIRPERGGLEERMAATYRHNKARGEHTIPGMSQFILDLSRRGKSDQAIASELGMDLDEVERLRVTVSLAENYADQNFTEAWEVDGFVEPAEWEEVENSDPFALPAGTGELTVADLSEYDDKTDQE